jgi:hypothetical protein
MYTHKLVSTGQEVMTVGIHPLCEIAPYRADYQRIYRPFLPHEGRKSGNAGEVITVRKSSIKKIQ